MKYVQTSLFDLDTSFGKMSPALSVQAEEKILGSSSKKSAVSRIKMPVVLDLREGANGGAAAVSWETASPWLGEFSTHSFGESPNVAAESHLSQILEDNPHPKYFLSDKACRGVLPRAEARGKELPRILKETLERHSGLTT